MHQTSHWVPGQWMGSKDLSSNLPSPAAGSKVWAWLPAFWLGQGLRMNLSIRAGNGDRIWDTCLDVSRGLMGKMVIYPLS